MILLKGCARCGGDVDATFRDDIYCIQCGHRPSPSLEQLNAAGAGPIPGIPCSSCRSRQTVRLEKLHPKDNACYRCRACGHIFSPGAAESQLGDVASP